MPNIETPEEFAVRYEQSTIYSSHNLATMVAARDVQYLALLKTCEEALEAARENLPVLDSAPNKIEPSAIRAARKVSVALAALREAGVHNA